MSAWPEIDFSDLVSDETGGNTKTFQSDYLPVGKYPIIDQGQSLIGGYTNDATRVCKAELPVVIFGDHTKCFKFIDFPFCLGADGTKVLRPKQPVDERYLYYALQRIHIPDAGYSRHFKYLKEGKIPLPPLDEQKRIAAILDQADQLRRKRQRALNRLNHLGQAIFHEMFGEWDRKGANVPTLVLGDHLDFLTSGSRGWAEYYRESGGLFLRIQNVKRDELDLSDAAYVAAPDSAEARRTRVQVDDVLLSITADLGRTAVIPKEIGEAYINQHLAIIRTKSFNPRFLSAALSSPSGQREILKRNREGVKAGLNFDDVRSVCIPNIPMEVQSTFADRLQNVDSLRASQAQTLAIANDLFSSLQHRAFRGEL